MLATNKHLETVINLEKKFQESVKVIPDFDELNRDKTLRELKEILNNLSNRKRELLYQKNKIKYPMFTNGTSDKGAIEINNALLFISTPRTVESIISALGEAVEMKRFDFVSTVATHILDTKAENQKSIELKSKVQQFIKNLYADLGLNDVEVELRQVDSAISEIENFIGLLNSKYAFDCKKYLNNKDLVLSDYVVS